MFFVSVNLWKKIFYQEKGESFRIAYIFYYNEGIFRYFIKIKFSYKLDD